MKFCPNCGEALEDDARFCPECGASVAAAEAAIEEAPVKEAVPAAEAEAPAEPRKKKSGVGKAIGIAALVILALLIAAAAVLYFTGLWQKLVPASRLKLGLAEKALVDRSLDDAFDKQNEPIRSALTDLKAKAEVTCEIDADGGMFSEITYIKALIDELKLDLDLDCDKDDRNIKLGLTYKGNPMLDGTVLINSEQLGLYIPQLDSNYYTISPEKLKELMFDEEGADIDLTKLDLSPFDEAKTRKEVMDLLKILAKLSTKENTDITKGFEVSLFDSKTLTKTDKYVITPTEEQLKAVIDELADYLGREASYLGGRLNGFYSVLKSLSGSGSVFFCNDAAPTETEVEELPETLSEFIKSKSGEIAKQFAEQKVFFEIYMQGDEVVSHRVISQKSQVAIDHVTEGKVRHVFTSVVDDDGDRTTTDVNIDETDLSKTVIDYKANAYGSVTEAHGVFDQTKHSAIGTMPGAISFKSEGEELVNITVAEKGDGMEHIIVITLPEYADSEINAIKIIANVTEGSGVSAPAGVSPVDLSDKSEEEIGEIFENMIEEFSDVLTGTLFGGMF